MLLSMDSVICWSELDDRAEGGLELLDVAQCCYKLTTKKLCVELQPLRVGDGATASDAPHHCGWRRLAHQPTLFAKTWQERNDLAKQLEALASSP
ncbi:hypothetical protein TSUD_287870 [Trifolium subterraneum]|uniref:Uncharacterized protein n=1 Tax=Trifolium subterraneum TaxID=3900 RepID=A0A2Z6P2Q6_TRISU|nr:hypothetical protein TSUD_287870 [Trifolium subterraneum]